MSLENVNYSDVNPKVVYALALLFHSVLQYFILYTLLIYKRFLNKFPPLERYTLIVKFQLTFLVAIVVANTYFMFKYIYQLNS